LRVSRIRRFLTLSHNLYTLWLIINGDMEMLAKIQKCGNSQGLRITKNLLTEAQIQIDDEVNLSPKNCIRCFEF
jgi:hypothetical protein